MKTEKVSNLSHITTISELLSPISDKYRTLTFRCLVYICIIKGITENPKIIYITAIYPYVVLFVFFFRAVTLEGMADGIVHLFKPKVNKYKGCVIFSSPNII